MTRRQAMAVRWHGMGIMTESQYNRLWKHETQKEKRGQLTNEKYMELKRRVKG